MSESKPSTHKSIGTVLIVGGCGFLGSAVVDQLLNFPSETASSSSSSASVKPFPTLKSRYPNYDQTSTTVHALDLKCNRNVSEGCTYHEADLTSVEQLLTVFKKVKPDVVINTASPSFEAPKAILNKVNIEGTKTLVEVAGGKHGNWGGRCKAFVHTSSSSVIHDTQSNLTNADERWPYVCPNPIEYYSETKVYAEKIVLDYNDKEELGHMLTCAVRPAGIIGERDAVGIADAVLRTAQVAPLWQLHLQLGENSNKFDATYVHNVVYGLLCAANALLETRKRKDGGLVNVLDNERVDGEAFIVTNDEPCYFWDITRYFYTGYGRDINASKIWVVPESFAYALGGLSEIVAWITGRKNRFNRQTVKYSCIDRYFNINKIKSRTGYTPIVGLEEGLARCVVWFKGVVEESHNKKSQ